MSNPIPSSNDLTPPIVPSGSQYDASAVNRARNLLEEMPEQIGRYRILERLGGGGMGDVYRAEQRSPVRREVAIKLIKLGMDTKLVIARFEAERQALAMMDHPNIAKVYDADADDTGRPFFVMEYVKGKPITEYADTNHLTIDERLELFEQVCHAIQHAHHKGIIHRDLKPSNVLVSTQDGKPLAKVIDFGIAKATSQRLTDKTLYTQHEQFIGTPQYVSPEQADGSLDIDTRTDVYSLGVLLYELLAGSTPFAGDELRAAAVEKIKQMIRDVDPPRPSTRLNMSTQTLPMLAAARRVDVKKLGSIVRGELDWIVMKALEKDRRRRYETPAALAQDIRAHLKGETVTAAPPTAGYRLRKFVARNQTPLTVAAILAVVLLAGAVVSTWQALRASRAERTVKAQLVEVDSARRLAEESRQLAQADQAAAERDAKLAAKSASLAQARYLIQQGDLPGAMTEIAKAAAGGLTYADRLVLDEAYRGSRDYWSLVSYVRTGSRSEHGCIINVDDKHTMVLAVVGSQLISYPTDTAKPGVQHLALDCSPQGLLATHAKTVVGWTSSGKIRTFVVASDSLTPGAKRDFDQEISFASASDESVTFLLVDGTCRTLDARTLETIHEWPASALPAVMQADRGKHCFASPDGNLILVHRGSWNMPVYALRPGADKAIEFKDIRMGYVAFVRPPPASTQPTTQPTTASLPSETFVTWMSPSGMGGWPDLLTTYRIDGDSKLTLRDVQTSESTDTKRRVAFHLSPAGRMTMFGEVGATWIEARYARGGLRSIRYPALWPFPASEPEYFTADESAGQFVLSVQDGLLVFARQNDSLHAVIDNYSGWGTRRGLLRIYENPDDPEITLDPYDATLPSWSVTPKWLKPEPPSTLRGFAPWRVHVSPDEQYAVILAQEDDEETISSTYGRKIAMIYDLHGDVLRKEGWQSAHKVEFTEVAGVTGFSNGLLRITPDGRTVMLGVRAQLHRYDVATGQSLGVLEFGQGRFDLSRDGKLVIGKLASAQTVAVYDTTSGKSICTLEGIDSFRGAAFCDDDASVIASGAGDRVSLYEIPSGRLVWTKQSNLIPRNWPTSGDQMLALAPETSGDGAMLVLADKNTFELLGVVSKVADTLTECSFSPSFDTIQTLVSRWQTRIVHMVDLQGLVHLLKTPSGAETFSGAEPVVDVSGVLSSAGAEITLRGAGFGRLADYMDRVVTVEATVSKVQWTLARNAVNIQCTAGAGSDNVQPILIWVNPAMLRKLRAAGMELQADKPTLEGKSLRVRGRVGLYGGYDSAWIGHPQIYAEDPSGFEILKNSP